VAIVIGAPVFRYYPHVPGPYLPEGLRLLRITDDPNEAARAPVGDSLVSDAVLAIGERSERVTRRPPPQIVEKQAHRMATYAAADATGPDGKLEAQALFETLRDATPENTVLVEESPSNLGELHCAWPIV